MDRLSPIELRIIQAMIVEEFGVNSPFLKQIPDLRFEGRNMTGTGYFVQFTRLQEAPSINDVSKAISTDLPTSLPAPQHVVGFTLFIDYGLMTSFEGYMFGDVGWPDDLLEKWLVLDAA